MWSRTLVACALILCMASAGLADKLILEDGTVKDVRIYRLTKKYISYLHDGKLALIARARLKDHKIEGKLLTDKELAEAIKAFREEAKKKVQQEEKKNGIEPAEKPGVKSAMDPEQAEKNVKIIAEKDSDTKAKELRIDPFPDHPVKEEKPAEQGKQPAGRKKARRSKQ